MISTDSPSILTNQPVLEGNMVEQLSGVKRTSEERGELERATPTKRLRKRRVSWAEKNEMHVLPINHKLFKDYKDEDIWYTVSADFDEPRLPPSTENPV
jgi:hypothetical protein